MKVKTIRILLFVGVVALSSCTSTKNIAMFQNLKKQALDQKPIGIEPPVYHIKAFDNLYISILTLDPEVNNIYNPSNAGSSASAGTDQAFGSPIGQLINGYRVAADGTINLPILGKLKVAGLELEEAEEKLKLKAEEYLQEPTVQIKLLNFKINVLGEVNVPGIVYNYEGSMNIYEAIGNASGITNFADLKNIVVNRQIGNMTNSFKIDLTKDNVYNSDVYYLQPNDLVYIPPTNMAMRDEGRSNYSLFLGTISSVLLIVSIILTSTH